MGGLAVEAADPPVGTTLVFTKDNASKTESKTFLRSRVTQYGITWAFDQKVSVGQFVNGDYYVVGPVTVVAIDPQPLFGKDVPASELDSGERATSAVRNGSMLNPVARQETGFDSGTRSYFKAHTTARLPIQLRPGDTLISSISLKKGEKCNFVMPEWSHGTRADEDNCPTRVAAVLTCVGEKLPADAFRPGYCDRGTTIYLARNLKRDKLPVLARIGGTPEPAKFAEVFQKPWVNLGFFGFDEPQENMPHYGQAVGEAVSDAGVLLCLDFKPDEKEKLLINFIQVGIDYWSMVKNGHPGWEGWGGHGSGRKFPIVFAGYMLGDADMISPTRRFPRVEFGEDNQTMYDKCWTGARVVFAGHSGISTRTGKPPRPQWGPYEHLRPAEWDKNGMKNLQSELYRRANSSCAWVGEALVLRLLKLEKAWSHDAFFDYVDRWMYEDDKPACAEIAKIFPQHAELSNPSKDWCHEGYTGDLSFVKPVWEKYRTSVQASIDGWKGKK
jgi:hypothetical protein